MGPRSWFVSLLASAVLILVAGPSVAQQSQEREIIADQQAWVTSTNVGAGGTTVGDPIANQTLQQGDLPVGADRSQETKRSYLLLDIPPEATAARITLERSESTGTNFGTPGPILACPLTEPFSVQTGDSLSEAPAVDCGDDPVVGEVAQTDEGVDDPTGAYTFVLDPILARWKAGEPDNNGIALVADIREVRPSWQVTFNAPFFEPIGTATVPAEDSDDGTSEDEFDPPPPPAGSTEDGGEQSNQDPQAQQQSTRETPAFEPAPVQPPSTSGNVQVPEAEVAPPPEVEDPEVAAPTDATDDEAPAGPTQVAAAGPLGPAPVNPLVWILVPVGVAALTAAGRGLSEPGRPQSDLDRLLHLST